VTKPDLVGLYAFLKNHALLIKPGFFFSPSKRKPLVATKPEGRYEVPFY